MFIAFSKIALHRIGKKKEQRMVRYDGFTLKKKLRDSRTDEAPRPHSSTRLFKALVVLLSERNQIDCIDCQSKLAEILF
jgi:hypothetical protein